MSINSSLKFIYNDQINNIPALVMAQIMAWRRPGDKPLSEPKIFSLLTHICVTRPQLVNFPSALPSFVALPGLITQKDLCELIRYAA